LIRIIPPPVQRVSRSAGPPEQEEQSVASKKSGRTTSRGKRTTPQRATSREAKRQEFSQPDGGLKLRWILPIGVAVAIVVVAAAAIVLSGGHKQSFAAASTTAAQSGGADVKIPVAQVNDGQVHFFTIDVSGTAVRYFVVKAPDGTLRTAFDACDVCYPYHKGYSQIAGGVQCNNCGRVFSAAMIDVQRGGCNPGPISAKVVGGKLVIPYSQLQGGLHYFA
jgi:uncharacterized membrane protein